MPESPPKVEKRCLHGNVKNEGVFGGCKGPSGGTLEKRQNPSGVLAALAKKTFLLALAAFGVYCLRVISKRSFVLDLVRKWQQRRRAALTWPSWPPSPRTLIWQGGITVAFSAVVLVSAELLGISPNSGDSDCQAWVEQEKKRRVLVLDGILQQLPIGSLCTVTPKLRSVLAHLADPGPGYGLSPLVGSECPADPIVNDFTTTAETVCEAVDKLTKLDRRCTRAWEGYAVAAALTASELQRARKLVEDGPSQTEDGFAAASDVQALEQRVQAAEELAQHVRLLSFDRCLSKNIPLLFEQQKREARRLLRNRRVLQLRCVFALLQKFRSALPFIALSSLLSAVIGACSAMRLHYKADLINITKQVVAGPFGPGPRASSVGEVIGAMMVSEGLCQLAAYARASLNVCGKARVIQQLKVSIFEALLRQDLEYLERADMWSLRSLITTCGSTIGQVLDFPACAIEVAVRLCTAVVALNSRSGRLTAFLAVAMPLKLLLGFAVDSFGSCLERWSEIPDFRGHGNAGFNSLVNPPALRTLRSFAREPIEVASFARFLDAQERRQQRGQLIYRMTQPLQDLVVCGTEVAVLWYGGRLAMRGEINAGDLASVVLVAQSAMDGVQYAHAAGANVVSHALGPMSEIVGLLTRKPRIGLESPPFERMPDPMEMNWTISFEDVSFSYPQRPGSMVLRGLSFQAASGDLLGILGTTGAGKSTIFALLLRLYEPTSGRITLDGRDLRSYNALWLRRNIGIVSQDLFLCQNSIYENLLYGCSNTVDDGEARQALRVAQCETTFFNAESFPSLWHSEVGKGGTELSGGERQRLAVAMAVLKKPRLLLLDEATSALDELSQQRLLEALEEIRQCSGMTVVCVAHRLSNLARASRLVVVAEGRAVEEGTPTDLLVMPGGVYAEYVRTHKAAVATPN